MVMKQFAPLYLDKNYINVILNVNSQLLLARLELYDKIIFSYYYYNALEYIRKFIEAHKTSLSISFICPFLIENALRKYIIYFKDKM